jgi:peptidoglycan/xylan/chitin deacetylase (PgdA/CDA1 family)
MSFLNFYYHIKPLIPRRVQLALRRQIVLRQREKYKDIWPIDERAGKVPEGWPGWPEGKQFALVLTHDVETAAGQEKAVPLAQIEKKLGFRSSFNFVGRDYPVYEQVRKTLISMGFEVGLHGLSHDNSLFSSRKLFEQSRDPINRIIKEWDVAGFRAPSMYHNLEWIGELDIEYDLSTFDTDPFEPQPDGMGTIFPFWVHRNSQPSAMGYNLSAMSHELTPGYVELPYTLAQDHLLFIILKERDIKIWTDKLDWVARKGGMALLNVHPDYIAFENWEEGRKKYPISFYEDFLNYVKENYGGRYWHGLPREISKYLREVKTLNEVSDNGGFQLQQSYGTR